MKQLERNLKALANGRRLKIVRYLHRVKEASVSSIAAEIQLSFKSTSRHLAVLSGAGVLEKKQVGLQMLHRISSEHHAIVSHVLKML
ncbi:winged helix-turn-helix transcriptional regulator [Candidatus Kaiserbacteria bacterium]|nr:winged helix-turn-helix transcriptional regulator [Candidatus Kaiserbacteria bacterium]